ncbi:pyruvate dehydrogenase (acetyl-transferring) E1 component subunit alpha [Thermanaerosceptrum fracticalcis]|uniref:Pyruvate dehydrogenase E1 component subunit alpha n=1 Tax=Thermanaerosceptrum fracticalcis TaxID=1712410 RepID=A0A7G6E4E7_THEFR|nr:pyruvate dehydrogenase (acetyl-transferring) E1 component subunit alpha [Thermanaerosceptrum fracticalcis]QNB46951.1 pyruvate dehydrogenase (acetyl-transferring) E1 component subunit alpha [Thermanaerosceptrum fracticalcis]
MEINKDLILQMYDRMMEIRKFEERAMDLFTRDKIRGSMHLYIGEEAVATGVCFALNKDDYIVSTHRGHGHCLAKGARIDLTMAELLGKATGYCKGKGGSMHIADLETGNLGANGIVGGGLPIAVGAALSARLQKNNKVAVAFFGDGASNQGTFHESMNLASAWKLPVLFVCENNLYGITVPFSEASAIKDVAVRARAYNMPSVIIDGNDVLEVYKTAKEAVEKLRKGEGPMLIEAKTYRHMGHYTGDPQIYRTKEEVEEWKKKDPIKRLRCYILENNIATEEELAVREKRVDDVIDQAEQFALNSPEPDAADLLNDVFA